MALIEEKHYYDCEAEYFRIIQDLLGDELLLYCVTGSLGRGDLIAGWSDIDILLVLSRWSLSSVERVTKSFENLSTEVKTGVTTYSLEEFNGFRFCDPKTLNTIFWIKRGRYRPRVCEKSVILTEPSHEIRLAANSLELTKNLHELKREIIHCNPHGERHAYKAATNILRVLLMKERCYVDGYSEIWTMAKKVFPECVEDIPSAKDVAFFPQGRSQRYQIYLNILTWLETSRVYIY